MTSRDAIVRLKPTRNGVLALLTNQLDLPCSRSAFVRLDDSFRYVARRNENAHLDPSTVCAHGNLEDILQANIPIFSLHSPDDSTSHLKPLAISPQLLHFVLLTGIDKDSRGQHRRARRRL
jgi:hypothetical protein